MEVVKKLLNVILLTENKMQKDGASVGWSVLNLSIWLIRAAYSLNTCLMLDYCKLLQFNSLSSRYLILLSEIKCMYDPDN